MKLSILVVATALFILVAGFQNPALFFIGYLWTSILYPSAFATTILPLSMMFGIASLVSYFFMDHSKSGRLPLACYVAMVFGVWVTLTTTWAVLPDVAWAKWVWAIESIILAIAAPLFLRTRAQIELALIAAFSALTAHAMTGGVKAVLGTGGYDRLGRLMMDNFWLGETSTLAMACVMSLPMGYYCINHSIIFERWRGKWLRIGFVFYAFLALMCVVGTSARTGVMCLGALLLFGIKGIFRKTVVIACAVGLYFFAVPYLPGKSVDRFATISTYQEDSSATVRLAIWKWAVSYAKDHPFGGGFDDFYTSVIDYYVTEPNGQVTSHFKQGTAPHSIYFEVLGEHGFPGIVLFLTMLANGFWGLWRLSRAPPAKDDMQWQAKFARMLFICLTIFCVGGAFVGIAFQPILYLLTGLYYSVYRLAQTQKVRPQKLGIRRQFFRAVANEASV